MEDLKPGSDLGTAVGMFAFGGFTGAVATYTLVVSGLPPLGGGGMLLGIASMIAGLGFWMWRRRASRSPDASQ